MRTEEENAVIKKRWNVSEGLYFQETSLDVFTLEYAPDETSIPLLEGEIDNMIKALERIKAHYASKELAVIEKRRLANWRKREVLL